jgi:hypothetical protein
MRLRGSIGVILLSGSALVSVNASLVYAQDGAQSGTRSEADVARARALFESATESLRTGRFAEAVRALRASLEIAPRSATAFNLAVALRGTGDALGAAALFDRLSHGEFGTIDLAKREEVERLRAEVAAEIGSVRITVRGADLIDVRLDGAKAGAVRDGEEISARLNPGQHRVIATARDRETAERTFDLPRGGSVSLELRLAAAPARAASHLALRSSDAEATIRVDGVGSAIGQFERDLAPGEYNVVVRNKNGERTTRVRLHAGRSLSLVLDAPTKSVFAGPWFWIGAGALIAGGVAVAVVATRPHGDDPARDPYWGLTSAAFPPPR